MTFRPVLCLVLITFLPHLLEINIYNVKCQMNMSSDVLNSPTLYLILHLKKNMIPLVDLVHIAGQWQFVKLLFLFSWKLSMASKNGSYIQCVEGVV